MLSKSLVAVTLALAAPLAQDAAQQEKAAPASQTFTIDGAHSSVVFRIKHLNASWFYGRFNQVSGEFRVNDATPSQSYVKIEIPTESIDSANAGRDRHLKSQDFFSVKEFPKITFASTKVAKKGGAYEITGDLSMRGVTKSITAKATHVGTANVNPRFGLRTGYEVQFTVKRSDFGMTYGIDGDVLGDEVTIMLGIEGMLPREGAGRRR